LKPDGSVLHGLSTIVHILTIAGSSTQLSISLINDGLAAFCEQPNMRVFVVLCPKLISNQWSQFIVQFFPANDTSGPLFKTLRNGEKLPDSGFSEFSLGGESIEIRFGGFAKSDVIVEPCIAGSVSDICVYNRVLAPTERRSLRSDFLAPKPEQSLLISTDTADILPNSVVNKTILDCMQKEPVVRKLVDFYSRIPDNLVIAVLAQLIRFTTDRPVPLCVLSILRKAKSRWTVYRQWCNVVLQIECRATQLIWFENIIINCELWDLNDSSILRHWTTELLNLFSAFFMSKSYFRYFLSCFPLLDSPILFFLKRIGHIQLTHNDVEYLFGALFEPSNTKKRMLRLLELIRDLASRIWYEGSVSLYQFVNSTDLSIAIAAIENLLAVSRERFTLNIISLLRCLQPTEAILTAIEARLDNFPGLFVVNCALTLINPSLQLSRIPKSIDPVQFWYFFPIICFLSSSPTVRRPLAEFLARNAAICDLEGVLCLTALLSRSVPGLGFDPFALLLECFAATADPESVIFFIFTFLICSFDVPCYSTALCNHFQNSPFAADLPKPPSHFSLSLSGIDAIRQWPIDDFPKQKAYPTDRFDNPLFGDLLTLIARAPMPSSSRFQALASRIRSFCPRVYAILKEERVESPVYSESLTVRNDLFCDVIARFHEEFCEQMRLIIAFLKLSFNEIQIPYQIG
jgi:hypothetical protein